MMFQRCFCPQSLKLGCCDLKNLMGNFPATCVNIDGFPLSGIPPFTINAIKAEFSMKLANWKIYFTNGSV